MLRLINVLECVLKHITLPPNVVLRGHPGVAKEKHTSLSNVIPRG